MNIVRTWTEHIEHEQNVHVHVHHLLKLNLSVQVQVQAWDPWTWTKPNCGQSSLSKHANSQTLDPSRNVHWLVPCWIWPHKNAVRTPLDSDHTFGLPTNIHVSIPNLTCSFQCIVRSLLFLQICSRLSRHFFFCSRPPSTLCFARAMPLCSCQTSSVISQRNSLAPTTLWWWKLTSPSFWTLGCRLGQWQKGSCISLWLRMLFWRTHQLVSKETKLCCSFHYRSWVCHSHMCNPRRDLAASISPSIPTSLSITSSHFHW